VSRRLAWLRCALEVWAAGLLGWLQVLPSTACDSHFGQLSSAMECSGGIHELTFFVLHLSVADVWETTLLHLSVADVWETTLLHLSVADVWETTLLHLSVADVWETTL